MVPEWILGELHMLLVVALWLGGGCEGQPETRRMPQTSQIAAERHWTSRRTPTNRLLMCYINNRGVD